MTGNGECRSGPLRYGCLRCEARAEPAPIFRVIGIYPFRVQRSADSAALCSADFRSLARLDVVTPKRPEVADIEPAVGNDRISPGL